MPCVLSAPSVRCCCVWLCTGSVYSGLCNSPVIYQQQLIRIDSLTKINKKWSCCECLLSEPELHALPLSVQDYHWPRSSISAHRVGLHGVECHLMGLVEVVSAVHLALKARLLPRRVVWAKLWGDHPRHWGGTVREDKRLEYRPSRVVGLDRERKRKEKEETQKFPSTQRRYRG